MAVGDEDGYSGPATLVLEGVVVEVAVTLTGFFQPVDGRYHWYGRIAADERVAGLAGAGATVEVTTPSGSAVGRAHDPDLWGRYRVDGVSTPPFRVPTTVEDVEVEGVF